MEVSMVWVAVALQLLRQAVSVSAAPVIDAPWGRIEGIDAESSAGKSYSAYYAIPYALPPVGERRFAKPVAHPGPGEGRVYSAVEPGNMCPQFHPFAHGITSEDCLTLDVHVPIGADGSNSVIIYIHGGSFVYWGSRIFTAKELVTDHDVVAVAIQYRLGAFGFLSSGDDALPGNYGLWDQHLAIRWVKDNIRAFGGNPDSITIHGQSAGSISTGHQLLSPHSKGLFYRAVLQSGFSTSTWVVHHDPAESFHDLARAAGCEGDSETSSGKRSPLGKPSLTRRDAKEETEKTVQCLRKLDENTLLRLSVLPIENLSTDELLAWLPVVDGEFVPKHPRDLLRDVDYLTANDVISRDVMLGNDNDEGGYMVRALRAYVAVENASHPGGDLTQIKEVLTVNNDFPRYLIREELEFRYPDILKGNPDIDLGKAVDVVDFFYNKPLVGGQVTLRDASTTFGDIYFNVPMVAMARDLADIATRVDGQGTKRGSLYAFEVNHYPARKAGTPFPAVTHGEELVYVFDNPYFSRAGFTEDDFAVGRTFRGILADFAKTGNPTTSVDLGSDEPWPQYSLPEEKYLSLGPTPRVAAHLYAKGAALWLDLAPNTLLTAC